MSKIAYLQVLLCENEEQVSMEVGLVAQETHYGAQQSGNVKWLERNYLHYRMSKVVTKILKSY